VGAVDPVGYRLDYIVRRGDLPSLGSPLVLLHAFPLDRRMWAGVAQHLAGFDVVLVDLPGLGGSSLLPVGEPSLDISSDGVARVLDELGVARAVLAGVSMGGYVALAFARRHRARLAGLAILDSRPDADGEDARTNRLRLAEQVLGVAGTAVLAPMLGGLLGPTSHARRPDLLEQVRTWLTEAPASGVAWSQRAMAGRRDNRPLLAGLALPAAIVVGEEDTLSPVPVAAGMADQLPDAVLNVIPEAGHLSPLERPDAVAAALTDLMVRIRD